MARDRYVNAGSGLGGRLPRNPGILIISPFIMLSLGTPSRVVTLSNLDKSSETAIAKTGVNRGDISTNYEILRKVGTVFGCREPVSNTYVLRGAGFLTVAV
jgi:hypothetical protein